MPLRFQGKVSFNYGFTFLSGRLSNSVFFHAVYYCKKYYLIKNFKKTL